jgi:signal peptidase I
MNTWFLLAALLFSVYLTSALFLWIGLRLARVPGVSITRVLVAALSLLLILPLVRLGFLGLGDRLPDSSVLLLGEIPVELLLSCVLVKILVRTSWRQSIVGWLGMLLGGLFFVALYLLVLGPYVTGAFLMPTMSMAPTLLGPHRQGTCPHCGGESCIPYDPEFDRLPPDSDDPGMCLSCSQAGKVRDVRPAVHQADRFLVNKTLKARRWDIIVFRYPKNPSANYAMRLAGLPGEEVIVKEGALWINGVKQEPPAELLALMYGAPPDLVEEPAWGTEANPTRLGPEELFVLGDFSVRARDSRFWGTVPTGNVQGVVGAIYWPPDRWRFFR